MKLRTSFCKACRIGKKKDMQFETYYQLLEDLLILFNHREREAKIYFKNTDKNLVDQIVNELNQIRQDAELQHPKSVCWSVPVTVWTQKNSKSQDLN